MTEPTGPKNRYTYADAGVDIDAGNAFVKSIGPLARATARPGAEAALGGFGALFDLKAAGYNDPLIVSATDGVGTKLELAIETNCHTTIGIDLVAMCVNDLIVQGAEPLFFLDYLATGKLDLAVSEKIVEGIAAGCKASGCALIGGETAEMPGLYQPGHYDLAGFSVGAVDRDKLLPQQNIVDGDVLIGLASSGIHSNGYSLVRKLISDQGCNLNESAPWDASQTLGEALLTPTKLYVTPLLPHLKAGQIKGLAHITGGGLTENLPRVLPEETGALVDLDAWKLPPVFAWLQKLGGMDAAEMLRTFNCGIGMILVVSPDLASNIHNELDKAQMAPVTIGHVAKSAGEAAVSYKGTL